MDIHPMPEPTSKPRHPLWEVILVFLKLGFTAFGGPAAHISMYRQEIVQRRKWISEEMFLDLLGATNLIPGPNSTEMVIHIGFLRAGWPGLIAGGLAFTLPAVLIVLVLLAVCGIWRHTAGRLAALWHQTGNHRRHLAGAVADGAQSAQKPALAAGFCRRPGVVFPAH
jgi:chromate transport protein ChrA